MEMLLPGQSNDFLSDAVAVVSDWVELNDPAPFDEAWLIGQGFARQERLITLILGNLRLARFGEQWCFRFGEADWTEFPGTRGNVEKLRRLQCL